MQIYIHRRIQIQLFNQYIKYCLTLIFLTLGCGSSAEPAKESAEPWPLKEEATEPPRHSFEDDPYWGKLLSLRYVDKIKTNVAAIGCDKNFNRGIPNGHATYAYHVQYINQVNYFDRHEPEFITCRRSPVDCIKPPLCMNNNYINLWKYNIYLSTKSNIIDFTIKLETDAKADENNHIIGGYWNLDLSDLSEDFKDYYLIISPIFLHLNITISKKDCTAVSLEEADRIKDALSDLRVFYEDDLTKKLYEPMNLYDRYTYLSIEDNRHVNDPTKNTHLYLRQVQSDLLLACQTSIR